MVNRSLILLSYGRESEYLRAIFCVLSFFAWYNIKKKTVRIIIFTDNPVFFQAYFNESEVEYVLLTTALLQEMLAGTTYIHRRKVSVIDLTLRKYPNEDLLFLDSDTFFIDESQELLDVHPLGKSFMHKREYTLEEGLAHFKSFKQGKYPEAFINYITDRTFMIGGVPEKFSKHDYCWNSGVLGLPKDFIGYMPDVFKLTDEFYANSQWFISEQIAFSLVLDRKTEIKATDATVLHYWGNRQKLLVDKMIDNLFKSKSPAELRGTGFFKKLTKRWKRIVETDLILEQAVVSFSQGYWKYGLKKSLQASLRRPANLENYKELLASIKTGLKQV